MALAILFSVGLALLVVVFYFAATAKSSKTITC